MDYEYRCVIDAQGYYTAFVLVWLRSDEKQQIEAYTLQVGESLLDAPPPGNFVRPKWAGEAWVEGASADEIAEWEAQQPPPIDPQPDPTVRIAELEQQVADLTAAIERGISL